MTYAATTRREPRRTESVDLQVLRTSLDWRRAGQDVWLATVIETYGSAPRPVGSMAALNASGHVEGSVSGGCVEDDLADWLARDAMGLRDGRCFVYGKDADERARLRLPCGGHLHVWLEPLPADLVERILHAADDGVLVSRSLDLASGLSTLANATSGTVTRRTGTRFTHVIGPTSRLILIGASEVSRCLAPMAQALGYQVTVIDPRREYLDTWPHDGCALSASMPDDAIAASPPDVRTAVVALSHDPKLDDMALLEALKSAAFYVGAMGSLRTTQARRSRLALFDLDAARITGLRGPVGIDIGARTPMEIAISVAADLVKVARGSVTATEPDRSGRSPWSGEEIAVE